MPKRKKEVEFPCNECHKFKKAPKRELTPFPDGQPYMMTGTCDNPESPLYRLMLVGTHTVSVNARHHAMEKFLGIKCFVKKKEPRA